MKKIKMTLRYILNNIKLVRISSRRYNNKKLFLKICIEDSAPLLLQIIGNNKVLLYNGINIQTEL